MDDQTIVGFAEQMISDIQKVKKWEFFRKMKIKTTFRGIELVITRKSTIFSILKDYKTKDKERRKEMIKNIEKIMKNLGKL